MAIDTRDERSGVILWGLPFRALFPHPDGDSGDNADRAHVAVVYGGLAAAEAQPESGDSILMLRRRRRLAY